MELSHLCLLPEGFMLPVCYVFSTIVLFGDDGLGDSQWSSIGRSTGGGRWGTAPAGRSEPWLMDF